MIPKGVESKGPFMRGLVSLVAKEGELRDLLPLVMDYLTHCNLSNFTKSLQRRGQL